MSSYISVQGDGRESTFINLRGGDSSALDANSAAVVGASFMSITNLTISRIGNDDYVSGLYNSGASPRVENVEIFVAGSRLNSAGIVNVGKDSAPLIRNSKITATSIGAFDSASDNTGVYNSTGSTPTLDNLDILSFSGNKAHSIENNDSANPLIKNTTSVGANASQQIKDCSIEMQTLHR